MRQDFFRILASFLLFLSLSSCGSKENKENAQKKLGLIYNLTGDQASLDFPSFQGAALAFHTQNVKGWELVFKDGESNVEVVADMTRELAAMHDMISLIGLSDDNMAYAAGQQAEDAHKLLITSGATSPLLPIEIPNYLYLVAFGDNAQAAAAAQYAYRNLSLKTAFIFYDDSMNYAHLLKGYFKASFEAYGGKIVGEQPFPHDPENIESHLAVMKKDEPDLIYLASGPEEALKLLEKIRSLGFLQPIFGGDSFDTPLLSAEKLDNIYYSTHVFLDPASSNPKVKAFIDAYKQAYHSYPQTSFAALGYDAVNLLFDVVKHARSLQTSDLLRSISQIKNFEGVTGTISYKKNSHVPIKPVTLVKIKDGKKTKVAEFIPEKTPIVD